MVNRQLRRDARATPGGGRYKHGPTDERGPIIHGSEPERTPDPARRKAYARILNDDLEKLAARASPDIRRNHRAISSAVP
jgi:hypothetical protein